MLIHYELFFNFFSASKRLWQHLPTPELQGFTRETTSKSFSVVMEMRRTHPQPLNCPTGASKMEMGTTEMTMTAMQSARSRAPALLGLGPGNERRRSWNWWDFQKISGGLCRGVCLSIYLHWVNANIQAWIIQYIQLCKLHFYKI